MHGSTLQIATDNDRWNVMLFNVGQQINICQYPVGDYDEPLHSLPQQDLKMAFKTRPLALCVRQYRKVRSLINRVLNAFEYGRTKWIGKVENQNAENAVPPAAQ